MLLTMGSVVVVKSPSASSFLAISSACTTPFVGGNFKGHCAVNVGCDPIDRH